MIPWRAAVGMTLIVATLLAVYLAHNLHYLRPHADLIWAAHGASIAFGAVTALAALFAGFYWLANQLGLAAPGRKLSVLDAALASGEGAHDADLAAALDRDRRGDSAI